MTDLLALAELEPAPKSFGQILLVNVILVYCFLFYRLEPRAVALSDL
jgi:hypothetical protein